MVLESSKHNSRGLEPLGDLGARRAAQTWLDLTVAPKGPWDHSQDPGFQPCLCIPCSVTWSLSLSLPRPQFPHLRSLTFGFGLGRDLISWGDWQGVQEGLSHILPPAQHQSRSRGQEAGSEPGEGELGGRVPEPRGLSGRSASLAL